MLTLRPATADDIPTILRFIRAIAEFERLSHQVETTEATLRESLFGERPAARVLLAEWQGQPVAYAVYFTSFSTFVGRKGLWLEDLFVLPEHRGRGFGRAVLAHLAREARADGCGRMEWMVLDWNRDAQVFYEGLGARPLDDWRVYRLGEEGIRALAEGAPPIPAQGGGGDP